MATVAWVRGEFCADAGDFNFGRFFRFTVALYHLGGICTIVVYPHNGAISKAAYHGRLSTFSLRQVS
jgi:hypothetical protein